MSDSSGGPSGPAWADTPVPFEESLDGTLGFEVLGLSDELALGRLRVTDRTRQMWGLVHGGVYESMKMWGHNAVAQPYRESSRGVHWKPTVGARDSRCPRADGLRRVNPGNGDRAQS